MAERVRINLAEKDAAVADIRARANAALEYINNELSSMVAGFANWWEGDAYNAFREDFEASKRKFYKDIYEETMTYADNLNKAVESQLQQDLSIAGTVKTN